MNKVLVTGGAGFVGHHLVNKLIDNSYDVVVLDDLSTGKINNINPKCTFIEGDIRNEDDIAKAINGCETIFHLAARVELQKTIINPIDCYSVNVIGTTNIIIEAIKNNSKIIFASSCAVYPLNSNKPLSENNAVNAESPYAISKLLGEQTLEFYRKNSSLDSCSLRCFNIYGKKQNAESDYSAVIPKFIKQAKNGETLKLFNNGNQTRDFIYIDDVIEAYINIANSNANGIFNLGTGTETYIKDLANIIINIENKSLTENLPNIKGDAIRSCANISKIYSEIGFKPKHTLVEKLIYMYNNPE
tara:strand:- start:1201 stop:2106 length:906 start_codon:yes stop_codon:yes gene_type:complete